MKKVFIVAAIIVVAAIVQAIVLHAIIKQDRDNLPEFCLEKDPMHIK